VVVDNNSIDDTIQHVKKLINNAQWTFPFIILKLNKNYGWGGGNNRGALLCKDSDYILFMNDDVILERDCIRKLIEVINKNRELAAVQPLIISRDRTTLCGADVSLSGFPQAVTFIKGTPFFKAFYVSGAALFTLVSSFFGNLDVLTKISSYGVMTLIIVGN